jgi:cyanophycinase
LPTAVLARFIELAGGPESLIVILPTAAEERQPNGAGERRMLEQAGARNLAVLGARERAEVESNMSLAQLAQAGGIWFGGGRQWRFVDAYLDTLATAAFEAVLSRGGAVGGSSAGASIQADYLVRGSPLRNTIMMAEGYERGLGFLPGVAIDQHFTQRRRHPDMLEFIRQFPQFLGVGIDESTALIVRRSQAQVLGEHSAWFFDAAQLQSSSSPIQVRAGGRFDLERRQVVAEGAGE